MTTTTPQRIGGWLLGPLAWLLVASVEYDAGVVAVYRCAILLRKHFKRSARQALTTQIAVMGRLFYYRYRHVVLHTVVDHRFL